MLLDLQDPCRDATERGFPPTSAYLWFQPDEDVPIEELIDLAPVLLEDESTVRVLVFRAFAANDHVADLDSAARIITAETAEGYALVSCGSRKEAEQALDPSWVAERKSQESAIAWAFPDHPVIFFHHSHHSMEVIGKSPQVRRCAGLLFDRYFAVPGTQADTGGP